MTKNKQLNFTGFSSSGFSTTKAELDELLASGKNRNLVRIVFSLIILMIILAALVYHHLPPQIPLFYSQPWGENQLADKTWLWLLPSVSLVFTLINLRLSSHSLNDENFLSQSLMWSSLLVVVLAMISFLEIIWLSI
jgi:hypothetical protein